MQFRIPLTCFALLITTLSACGGDGSGSGSQTNQDDLSRMGLARFSAQIKDASGAGVADAEVLLPVNQKIYGTKTGADGSYSFTAPVSEFSGINPVALIVNKAGYRPKTYYYGTLKAGTSYTIDSAAQGNAIEKLAEGEFVPENGHLLWHLGDATFAGASNSQLQVATSGLYKGMKVTPVTSDMIAKYKRITLSFVARGIDTTRGGTCKNRVGVFQVDDGNNLTYSQEAVPDNGPSDGSFGTYSFTFNASNLKAGQTLYTFVNSGSCTNGDNGDDFEFTQTLIKFEGVAPAAGTGSGSGSDIVSGTTPADVTGCARIYKDAYQDGQQTLPPTIYAVGSGAASAACQRLRTTWTDYLANLESWVARCASANYSGVTIGSHDYGTNPPDWATLRAKTMSAYQADKAACPGG